MSTCSSSEVDFPDTPNMQCMFHSFYFALSLGILCVCVADLNYFMMLMWQERTLATSGRLRGALDSCLLMHMEKLSSWGKAVKQKDLQLVTLF